MAEPLKATFFAFRRRARRGVLTRAFLVHGFSALALVAIAVAAIELYREQVGFAPWLVQRYGALPLLGACAILLFLYSVNAASYETACLRWLIRNEQRGFWGMSFDRDTWRIVFGEWLWLVIYVLLWLVSFVMAAVAVIPIGDSANASLWVPVVFFSIFGLATLLVTIRFGAGNAVGLARRRFAFFDGWKAGKARFWALLGSWLIATAIWTLTGFAMMLLVALSISLFAQGAVRIDTAFGAGLSMFAAIVGTRFLLTPLIAGINARAVLAAASEGHVEGFQPTESVARVFE